MKILKYLLIALAVILILFFGMGLIMPSVSYGHTISVDKPIKEAWAVSQDQDKYHLWLEGFKSMELLEGEYFEVGSKYKVIVEPGEGQPPFEMIETIESIEEFEHVTMNFDSDMMDFYQHMTFEENDGVTTVTTDSKVMAKGLMTRSMFALMEVLGGSFTKQEKKNVEALKELIQNNETDYFPEPVEERTEDELNMG